MSVFYDEFEEAKLWGKNLYTYLRDIYRNRARFTVVFCSQAYANKLWTNHSGTASKSASRPRSMTLTRLRPWPP